MFSDKHNDVYLLKKELFKSSVKDKFKRCQIIADKVADFVRDQRPDVVICEYPHKGGPGWSTGNITILFHFCGVLQANINLVGLPVTFIPVTEWKGQVPKDIMNKRTEKKYGTEDSADILDSIGLGHYYLTKRSKDQEEA